MESYSNNNKYLLSTYLLIAGRAAFILGLLVLAMSIYYGGESQEIKNSIKPDPAIIKYAYVILSTWVLTIPGSVVIAFDLRCDNCQAKLCFVPHGYKSKSKRNWLVAFFYPDELYERKFTCFNCNTGFKL